MSQRVAQSTQVAVLLVTLVATLSLYNYPRTWWQETVTQTAPLWAPVLGTFALFGLKRVGRSLSIAFVVLVALCLFRVVRILGPYLYSPPKSYSELVYSEPVRFLVVDTTRAAMPSPALLIESENPDIVVVNRDADVSVVVVLSERYPFVLASSIESTRKVEIFSKSPLGALHKTEYGFEALPAVFGDLQTADGFPFKIGAFDLVPASSQDAFNKSRLTSRRLASAIKFTKEPRIVVGAFRASVTSQIVDMYVDQLKLRSIFFNQGFVRVFDLVASSLPFRRNLNVFTARKIQVSDVRELHTDDQGFSVLSFTARIPRLDATQPEELSSGRDSKY